MSFHQIMAHEWMETIKVAPQIGLSSIMAHVQVEVKKVQGINSPCTTKNVAKISSSFHF